MMMNPSPSIDGHNSTTMPMKKMMMHMTFYWGKNADILISGWPGSDSGPMYTLCLLLVFLLAFLVEWLSRSSFVKPSGNDVVSGISLTFLHALRMGLAYLVMLAVMSFNGGVFIVAVSGHAIGFLVFGTRVFKSSRKRSDDPNMPPYEKHSDLPPMSC